MKYAAKFLFFAVFFSYLNLPLHADLSSTAENPRKLHLDTSDIYIDGKTIYVQVQKDWIPSNAIRSDERGFYVLEEDVRVCRNRNKVENPQIWRCPYCNRWWQMGEKCTNEDCPTNLWEKKEEENLKPEKPVSKPSEPNKKSESVIAKP